MKFKALEEENARLKELLKSYNSELTSKILNHGKLNLKIQLKH